MIRTGSPLLLVARDAAGAVELIDRFLSDPTLQQRLFNGLSAYNHAVSLERMADRLYALYQECAEP